MKKDCKFLKIVYRVIPCMVCFMIVISSLTMPAQAAGADWTIDYNDYIEDLQIDGDTGIVTVHLPKEFYYIKLYEYFGSQIEGVDLWWGPSGKPINVSLSADTRYVVVFYSNPNKPFYLGNIPDGAKISVTVGVREANGNAYETPNVRWLFKSWNSDHKWLADTYHTFEKESINGNVTASALLDKTVGSKTAYAGVFGIEFFNFVPLSYSRYYFEMLDFSFSFPVSSLTADKIMNDQNQKLMKDINTKLEKQGQTLDSILSGTPDMNDQVDSSVNNMQSSTDKLGQLGDSMKVEQPDVSGIKTDLGDLVDFDAVLAFVNPFMRIWDNNSLLFSFLTIVLTLVIVSWVMFGKKG